MIRKCEPQDLGTICEIINDAAQAYLGVIPADCLKEPYMPLAELQHEIDNGVSFWGYEVEQRLAGVMGIQSVLDVTLIRHAYVRTEMRNHGIGRQLLSHLRQLTERPILIGTWADANWAIGFYRKNGFNLVTDNKERLLQKYWIAPQRQIDVSVVLADQKWFASSMNMNGAEK